MNKTKRILLFITIIFAAACNNNPNINKYSPWKFAVFCDTRGDKKTPGKECLNRDIIKKIAQDIVAEGCELVIVPGDLIYSKLEIGCTLSNDEQFGSWKEAMTAVYEKKIPVHTIRGNHESGPRPQKKESESKDSNFDVKCNIVSDEMLKSSYLNAFGTANPQNGPDGEVGLTYYFTHKNAFFVGFDAYVKPNRVNLSWFKQILKERDANTTPHLFTYSHCPAYEVVHEDSLACYPQQRDEFWNLLAENGGKLYFCGHDHMYDRASVTAANGVEVFQTLVGSCGAPFKTKQTSSYKNLKVKNYFHNDTNYGYLIVTVAKNNLNVEWRALSDGGALPWESKDNFTCAVNTL